MLQEREAQLQQTSVNGHGFVNKLNRATEEAKKTDFSNLKIDVKVTE